jgi:hypothetical protein
MKISLLKVVQDPKERDPSIKGSEAEKFLRFLLAQDGWSNSQRAWQQVFSEYNKKAQEDFIKELQDHGWVAEEMVNRLDFELIVTEKGRKLFA